ncbi:trypsin-like peptidase domain-containing protein [Rhizobium sp. P32RR-XVIII]|uniref:trypsin-like peptidase domain-containing protein n=1 Tax=Rhizobium sp. P32RR-XVIII TaxID=2726738 RepID=UPI001FEE1D98|nr:trypsin-like peptidase domain-containing protein [Rhizobium sp. P32RR-XVIII]
MRWIRRAAALLILALTLTAEASATGQPSLAPMIARVGPSVVSVAIQTEGTVDDESLLNDPFFHKFFGLPEDATQVRQALQTTGSGVIVDASQGYILTSYHVVENASSIGITLANGDAYAATIIGTDPDTDLAVLKIRADGLTSIEMGESTELRVGDYVAAIGNPFGLGQTVTLGIVSALGRAGLGAANYENFIQTDASINPGNSGGALVDLDGKLVGINSAIIGPSGANVGIGFAIPITMAKGIMTQLIAHGEIKRGQLGTIIQDNNFDLAAALAVDTAAGAVVSEVVPGSPGAKAGIIPGDVVVAVDEAAVRNAAELRNMIASYPPESVVRLSIKRPKESLTITAKLRPLEAAKEPAPPASVEGEGLLSLVTLTAVGPESDAYGKTQGAFVAAMSDRSRAAAAGLEAGDVVVSVNRKDATDPQMVVDLAAASEAPLLLGVFRDGHVRFLVVK